MLDLWRYMDQLGPDQVPIVRPYFLTRDLAVGGLFDGNTGFGWHRALAVDPLIDKAGRLANQVGNRDLRVLLRVVS